MGLKQHHLTEDKHPLTATDSDAAEQKTNLPALPREGAGRRSPTIQDDDDAACGCGKTAQHCGGLARANHVPDGGTDGDGAAVRESADQVKCTSCYKTINEDGSRQNFNSASCAENIKVNQTSLINDEPNDYVRGGTQISSRTSVSDARGTKFSDVIVSVPRKGNKIITETVDANGSAFSFNITSNGQYRNRDHRSGGSHSADDYRHSNLAFEPDDGTWATTTTSNSTAATTTTTTATNLHKACNLTPRFHGAYSNKGCDAARQDSTAALRCCDANALNSSGDCGVGYDDGGNHCSGEPWRRLPSMLEGLGALQVLCSCWRTATSCLKTSLQGERVSDSTTDHPADRQTRPRLEPALHEPRLQFESVSPLNGRLGGDAESTSPSFPRGGDTMMVTEERLASPSSSSMRGMRSHDHNFNHSLTSLKESVDLESQPENFNDPSPYAVPDINPFSKTNCNGPNDTLHKHFPNGFPDFNNFHNNAQGFYDNFCYDAGYASEKSLDEEDMPAVFDIETLDSSRDETRTPESREDDVDGGDRDDEEETEKEDLEEESPILHLLMKGVQPTTQMLMDIYPFINEGTMFDVTIEKNSRGLGLSLSGGCETKGPYAGLLRIKRLYPQMPAWLCGQLRLCDIVLEANGLSLTGLASHEALEVIRTTKASGVNLLVCRPPPDTLYRLTDSPQPGSNTSGFLTGPAEVVSSSLLRGMAPHSPHHLAPSPGQSICGEFEISLTKVKGSLGFTLRKRDNSVLGHTIRTLVREPALTDGRIKPGDKILSVNGMDLCGLSHEEAIAFLRTTPETVSIRLYRDVIQTPVSPLSPSDTEDSILKPKPLRQEARDMLSDLAFRKRSSPSMSPANGGQHSSSPGHPRRRRLQKTPTPEVTKIVVADRFDSLVRRIESTPEGFTDEEAQPDTQQQQQQHFQNLPTNASSGQDLLSASNRNSCASSTSRDSTIVSRNTSNASTDTNSEGSETRRKRPTFLDLDNRQSCPRKTQFTPPHEIGYSFPSPLSSSDHQFLSMGSVDSAPPLGSTQSVSPSFGHDQLGYQSVNFGHLQHHNNEHNRLTGTASDYTISSYKTNENNRTPDQMCGLLKWKGTMMAPDEEDGNISESEASEADGATDKEPESEYQKSHRKKEVTITLQRGWNSRLGFSIQPEGDTTKVVAIYAGCVAAKDGRLKLGDEILKVNGEDVTRWDTERVIDLLRKTHGKIVLSVLQDQL